MGMEELFDAGPDGSERVDINLWIFPHLREFLAVDLRWDDPRVRIMDSSEVFGDAFYQRMEDGFGRALREGTDYPFAHLIDLPLRVEELVRDAGMLMVLDCLGRTDGGDELPTVAVYIVSGAALGMNEEQISSAFDSIVASRAEPRFVDECSRMLKDLISQEHEVVKRLDRQELSQALEDQSPNFFTLWERRN